MTSVFASAHSRGLRPPNFGHTWTSFFFASAHSRGLRPHCLRPPRRVCPLCLSAFARVATLCACVGVVFIDLCLSAFARVATQALFQKPPSLESLPQRIRAGCDEEGICPDCYRKIFASAHSRGLRPDFFPPLLSHAIFASAHSRGLRPRATHGRR